MPAILMATDNTEDAKIVELKLTIESYNIFTSTHPDTAMQVFKSHHPDVLVLALNTLEKAERYYLGLYRLCSVARTHPH